MTRPRPCLDIANRSVIAAWVFMAIWIGFLIAMTWVLHRDGPHPSQPAWVQQGAIGLFWLVGLPVTLQACAEPVTRLRVYPDRSATITRRSLLTRKEERYPPGSISAVELRQGKDSDGDPVFRATLVAADGRERLIREGPDAADQDAVVQRARAALGLG
ncbi:MAG TPA: hypothetical protein VN329_16945 [Roseomonas sp.]|nr:hypothetical protein [Roseomonas sp.]